MFGSFGTQELILILVLVLVLFGARRIPEIMRGFGEGIREFKSASQKAMDEIDQVTKAEPAKPVVKAAAPGPEDSAKVEP